MVRGEKYRSGILHKLASQGYIKSQGFVAEQSFLIELNRCLELWCDQIIATKKNKKQKHIIRSTDVKLYSHLLLPIFHSDKLKGGLDA
jgi:hypothetical protein